MQYQRPIFQLACLSHDFVAVTSCVDNVQRRQASAQLPGQPVVTQSPRMLARYGTGSVAEAAALAAAGPHSALSVTRLVADDGSATLALAVGQGGPLNCCLAHASQAKNQGATA